MLKKTRYLHFLGDIRFSELFFDHFPVTEKLVSATTPDDTEDLISFGTPNLKMQDAIHVFCRQAPQNTLQAYPT